MSQRSEKLHRRVSRLEEQVQFLQNSADFDGIFRDIQQEREEKEDRVLHTARKRAREAERAARMWRALAWAAVVVALVVLFLALQDRAQAAEVTPAPEPVRAEAVHYDPPPQPMPEVDVSELESTTPRYALTVSERDIVERVVMAEAGGEGFDGQRLVAQCILNTAEAMDMRPDEVVTAPNQYAAPAEHASEMVMDAVSAVFDDGDMVTDEPIRWFYAPRYVDSAWHESKRYVLTYQNHKFFAEW